MCSKMIEMTLKLLMGTFVVIAILGTMGYAQKALAQECPRFTIEQEILLRKAHAVGQYADWGYTLAGIVWRESIVGTHIVRVNGTDGNEGSYGVVHMQLTTAMYLLGVDNIWEGKAEIVPLLMNDDVYALNLALEYLMRHEHLGWRGMIARYNGRGEAAQLYAEDVVNKALILQQCLSME